MARTNILFIFASNSQFKASTAGFCTPNIKLLPGGPDGVKIYSPDPQNPDGSYPSEHAELLIPKGKHPDLTFTVVDGTIQPPDKTAYFLGGMALNEESRKLRALHNCHTFPKIEVDFPGNDCACRLTLDVKNSQGHAGTYSFLVLVQNRDGQVGLIDPRIVNED